MRTLNATLEAALANQQGEIILRVNTWTDQADYVANPTTPDNTWDCLSFNINEMTADAVLVTENDYTLSAFTVFTIERGASVDGVEYTIESGLHFVTDYKEDYGTITIKGSIFPDIKLTISAGLTYEGAINEFCTAIGKTGTIKNYPDDAYINWPDFGFLPSGKTLILNKAEQFMDILKQKFLIMVYEESPNNLVFYNLDSYRNYQFKSICWSPSLNLFCAVADYGLIKTSTDGETWDTQTGTEANAWQGICWSPELNLFCAVAASGTNRVMTSPDGINWTARSAAETNNWYAICWSPELNLFCAVANSGTHQVMTSPDGITWTARTHATTLLYAICWSPQLNLFCAVGQQNPGNAIMTSPDGINWTARSQVGTPAFTAICWSPQLNLFCTTTSQNDACIQTSPDGINWTLRTTTGANGFNGICWSPELNLFCAVSLQAGTDPGDELENIMTSPDGINWTIRTVQDQNQWTCIAWSPELNLFAIAAQTGVYNRIETSSNGITWYPKTADIDWYLTTADGVKSHIIRSQHQVHFIWKDQFGTQWTEAGADTTLPAWNLGYIAFGDSDQDILKIDQDPYYKFFLQTAPVRLDITSADKIKFLPNWSIDPTKTIDAMVHVSEHLNLKKSPAWYQEIKSIIMFDTSGG